jgi:hypothetical protein
VALGATRFALLWLVVVLLVAALSPLVWSLVGGGLR